MALGTTGTKAEVIAAAQFNANINNVPVYVYYAENRYFSVFTRDDRNGQLVLIVYPS